MHRLIGGDERAERFCINLRVRMRNQFEHDVINPRQSCSSSVQEAGQFPAVAARQMPLGHLDLLLNQVKIIEQPFGGGGDASARFDAEGRAVECP